MSFLGLINFNKLKDGLSKTKDNLLGKINSLIHAKKKIDEDFLQELEEIFLLSDMGYDTAEKIISNIKESVKLEKYETEEELYNIVEREIKKIFTESTSSFKSFDADIQKKPYVIMIVGVNGVGKTTSIGKLAYNFKKVGKSVLIGSADTYRAAANEQLEIWAKRAGVDIVYNPNTKDPASVAYETLKKAVAKNIDIVIIDTAGRLHNKAYLMEELKKVKRVMQKVISDAPDEVFLVIDATTGQNGLNQAKEFEKALEKITGIILTKLDGTAKGGIVLKICNELKIPVRFVGVGEKIDDLQLFNPDSFIKALFIDEYRQN
ncbi:MAG: signal recognition particle-docking protein FtsY [Ignavibacteria bacterium]|nr:signal recognition particle-docking protein FtsY [Ignavibacteria bacterium]